MTLRKKPGLQYKNKELDLFISDIFNLCPLSTETLQNKVQLLPSDWIRLLQGYVPGLDIK